MSNKEDITVVFTNRAYNAIINESFAKSPLETGGVLLGYILDSGVWVVVETLPPGPKSNYRHAFFEYDEEFVNYLVVPVATQYKNTLQVLGLWHRHPGSMDTFSSTDDGTNIKFAERNFSLGAISGLVNIDPAFRLTMYHVDSVTKSTSPVRNYRTNNAGFFNHVTNWFNPNAKQLRYTKIEVVVDKYDNIIPPNLLSLKYDPKQNEHPKPSAQTQFTPNNKTTQKTITPQYNNVQNPNIAQQPNNQLNNQPNQNNVNTNINYPNNGYLKRY
ncbi:MAG: Mov34/MPN/PAD-1 family protein [Planctomycetaceae bacterium]|jgi:proteasome lid subunit RPN8/RPN11|nr:Mov34/MPN/PAD-1 family protein [Planctomycetaceae bacterium]